VRVVPAAAVLHLFGRQAEEEEILLTLLPSHLDGGAVACADRQRTVHHELHVARAAGFVARRRDLLRHVAGGNQLLRQADFILGQEEDLESAADGGVGVDDAGHVADQLNDELRR
jgi:hypothetical protein